MRNYGGWFSPNGKYIYFMEYGGGSPTESYIRALERASGKLIDITTGLYVYYSSSNIEASSGSGRVFFYAETNSAANDENLYYFDQDTASPAVKLTSFTSTNYIYDIAPSDDGSLVAFGAGSGSTSQQMYVVEVSSTPVVRQLTTTAGYVMDMKMFTSDNKAVVYGTGSSSYKPDVRVQLVTGGPAKVLETENYNSVMMVWK